MKKRTILGLLAAIMLAVHAFGAGPLDLGCPVGPDPLRNTSRLTDDQLRLCFELQLDGRLEGALDRDRDGLADFTGIEVWEFVYRMKLILSDREPFDYSRKVSSPRELDFLNLLLCDLLDT